MAEDDSTLGLDSSLESDVDLTDTSDEETSTVQQELKFYESSDSEKSSKSTRWWKRSTSSYQPLSIQSGDIVHSDGAAESIETNLTCWSQTKKKIQIIFNWILKFVFFHRRVPVTSLIFLAVNVVVCILLVWGAIARYPPDINISLRSFTIPNHPAQKHMDAFAAAKAGRYVNASANITVAQQGAKFKRDIESVIKRAVDDKCPSSPQYSYQTYAMKKYGAWNVDIVYQVRGDVADTNLLTKERLSQIQEFESTIYHSASYSKVCYKKTSNAPCDRLTSLMTSLYPTNDDDGSFVYNTTDGFTPNLTNSLLLFENYLDQALWFTGGQITIVRSTNQIKARLLRSQLSVGLPLPCYDGITRENLGSQKDAVWRYFYTLVPIFEKANAAHRDVEILYGGTALYDYQVDNAKLHDALLSVASFVLILVVVYILSGFSVWLTVLGLYGVFSCFPWAYFVYRVVLGIETLNVLNIISLFVVIGIGVDDVFVFINTFKQSANMKSLPLLHERLGYTILTAGKATFVTSLTTSVAFFANAISSIPAVRQFGIFMGLVVIFCYLQVLVVLPLSLHVWHCSFRYLENWCFYPCSLLCRPKQPSAPNVRMSELENGSQNESDVDTDSVDSDEIEAAKLVPSSDVLEDQNMKGNIGGEMESRATVSTQNLQTIKKDFSPVNNLTSFLQKVMLHGVARPLLFFQLLSDIKRKTLLYILKLACVWVYIFCLVLSIGVVFGLLRFTDRPPQFFNSNTNIQKMIDLGENLTDSHVLSCVSGCGGGSLPYVPPPSTGGNGGSTSTKPPSPSTPSHSPPPTTHFVPPPTHSTPPPTHSPPDTHTTTPSTHPPTHASTQAPPPTDPLTDPPHSTHPSQPTQPAHTTSKGGGSHVTSPPVTSAPTTTPGKGDEYDILSSLHSNNAVVNVVFGIKDVARVDSSSFLPGGDFAVEEDSFYGNLTCRSKPGKIDLTGTIRALCRICSNISNPNNGLIMEGNFNCFPQSIFAYSFSCFASIASGLSECRPIFGQNRENVSVAAVADMFTNRTDGGSRSVRFLAMAFRSTTNPNKSPSESVQDYQRWEDFLSEEVSAIKQKSGPGEDYEGADQILSSVFQTTSKWVEVNIETLAVDGSLYGICVSVLLCLLIIVFLTHNWRIFFAIKLTVLNIIFSLLALFVALGWKLGIVEAITLTIVVGNSLDYCIHLCEGYMSASPEQIAYVEQFKFLSGASIRVKRVAVSISFVGVSIVSSAVTTILATVPMLFTTIDLFTRFGQILLLNTLLAISYTLIFCSTLLALFGPSDSKFTKARALNAVLTICITVVVYPLMLILVLYILSLVGVPILTPEGYSFF